MTLISHLRRILYINVLNIWRIGTDALKQTGGVVIRIIGAGFEPLVDFISVDLLGGQLCCFGNDLFPVFPGCPAEQAGAYDYVRGNAMISTRTDSTIIPKCRNWREDVCFSLCGPNRFLVLRGICLSENEKR